MENHPQAKREKHLAGIQATRVPLRFYVGIIFIVVGFIVQRLTT